MSDGRSVATPTARAVEPASGPLHIVDIEAIPLSLPFRHPGTTTGFGGREWPTIDLLLVRVTTASGIVGWGEAFGYNAIPATSAALSRIVAPLAIGSDGSDVRGLTARLGRSLHLFGRGGPVAYAVAGLELALWDAIGRHQDESLCDLIGGTPRPIPAYASLVRYGDADVVARATAECVEGGYGSVKLHEVLPEIVLAARSAGGADVGLMVDANCEWTPDDAVEFLRRVAPAHLRWIEEPVWPPEDLDGLRSVRLRMPEVPVAAGENASSVWELGNAMRSGAVDVVQPSLMKIGGIVAGLDALDAARSTGIEVALHSPFFGPGLAASLHVATLLPATTAVEWLYCELEAPLFQTPIDPVEGVFAAPSGPGLGVEPDPEVIARFRTD